MHLDLVGPVEVGVGVAEEFEEGDHVLVLLAEQHGRVRDAELQEDFDLGLISVGDGVEQVEDPLLDQRLAPGSVQVHLSQVAVVQLLEEGREHFHEQLEGLPLRLALWLEFELLQEHSVQGLDEELHVWQEVSSRGLDRKRNEEAAHAAVSDQDVGVAEVVHEYFASARNDTPYSIGEHVPHELFYKAQSILLELSRSRFKCEGHIVVEDRIG